MEEFEKEIIASDATSEKTQVSDEIIDMTKKQETVNEPKKSNKALLWGLVAIVVVLIIAGVFYYMQLKKKKDELNK